jgi:hypothetical protein
MKPILKREELSPGCLLAFYKSENHHFGVDEGRWGKALYFTDYVRASETCDTSFFEPGQIYMLGNAEHLDKICPEVHLIREKRV